MTLPLRTRAEEVAARFPPLLVRAETLASSVIMGEHGRRRAGMGENFWQYRPATAQDDARHIDWRRSARSDASFVQDKEWQIAQTVSLWVDQSASLDFASGTQLETKLQRARLIGLASAILMLRAGERVGLVAPHIPAKRGSEQILRLTSALSETQAENAPRAEHFAPHARAIFISDFFSDLEAVETALTKAASLGVSGLLLQVLDPAEETFPFGGRTIFESVDKRLEFETLRAKDLRPAYLERLAERKDRLQKLAQRSGWHYQVHHTDQSSTQALLSVYAALERQR